MDGRAGSIYGPETAKAWLANGGSFEVEDNDQDDDAAG
jgi:hypothetical protein